MKHLVILCLLFSSPVFAQVLGMKKGNVTVNEVVQFIYKSQQDEIIKEINKGLREKKTHKGKFFLGEVEPIDKVMGHAKMQNLPEVSAIENGFKFELEKKVITVEIRNLLVGLVYVNGVKINIHRKMSYNSLLRKVTNAVRASEKKQSSFNPVDLFIDKAHALWPAVAVAAVAGGVIVYGIDTLFSRVGHALNYDNKKVIDEFEEKLSALQSSCESDLAYLRESGGETADNSAVNAVTALGDAIDKIKEDLTDEDDKLVYCKELARSSNIEFESNIFKVDYDGLIKKGCDSMEKVHKCLIATKSYMENKNIRINENEHKLEDGDTFNPYVDAVKSAIGK